MKKKTLQKHAWIAYIVFAVILMANNAFPAEYSDSIEEISRNFPNSIRHIIDGSSIIEFCPDNTCDAFVAQRHTSLESLKDFVYLFVFYYSDYHVIDSWRNEETAKTSAEQILSKPQYRSCYKTRTKDTARCILIHLSKRGQIKLLAVRYDEHRRNIVKRDLNAVLSKMPVQKKSNKEGQVTSMRKSNERCRE